MAVDVTGSLHHPFTRLLGTALLLLMMMRDPERGMGMAGNFTIRCNVLCSTWVRKQGRQDGCIEFEVRCGPLSPIILGPPRNRLQTRPMGMGRYVTAEPTNPILGFVEQLLHSVTV